MHAAASRRRKQSVRSAEFGSPRGKTPNQLHENLSPFELLFYLVSIIFFIQLNCFFSRTNRKIIGIILVVIWVVMQYRILTNLSCYNMLSLHHLYLGVFHRHRCHIIPASPRKKEGSDNAHPFVGKLGCKIFFRKGLNNLPIGHYQKL